MAVALRGKRYLERGAVVFVVAELVIGLFVVVVAASEEDQLHFIKEAQVHPLTGQSPYLQKEHKGGLPAIDLNIPACEEQQEEAHEGQSHYLQKKQQYSGVHAIDLNIPVCEGQEEQFHKVLAVQEPHQQGSDDFNFAAPLELDDSALNLEAVDHQHELQQMINMIEDMHDYGVYAEAVDIVFDQEQLEDSDIELDEHANTNNPRTVSILSQTRKFLHFRLVVLGWLGCSLYAPDDRPDAHRCVRCHLKEQRANGYFQMGLGHVMRTGHPTGASGQCFSGALDPQRLHLDGGPIYMDMAGSLKLS